MRLPWQSELREAVCTRLGSSPYVCNGCDRFHNCPLKKRLYVAKDAQANYAGTLRESKSGVRPDDEFVRLHGERGKAFLDALGIVRVPANEVTLDPILLGKRFKRHAEKVRGEENEPDDRAKVK